MNELVTRITLLVRRVSYMCFLSLLVATVSAERRAGSSNDFDHLIPVDSIMDPAYEKLLAMRLFIGSTDMLRIIVVPSSASGEMGIAIRQSRTDGSDDMIVICTQAKKNLWSAAVDTNRNIVRNPAINTNRSEAPLPKSEAIAVIASIKRVLQRTRRPTKTERVIEDATLVEFSVVNEKGGTTRGLLNPNAYGKSATALRRLVQLLEAYCRAKPEERSELLKKLDAVAKGI